MNNHPTDTIDIDEERTMISHMAAAPATSDAGLAGRLQQRDRSAWDELYRTHEGRVYGFAYRLTGNPHDAADLTQETFVRVLGRLDKLDFEHRDLSAYLLATTKNLFLTGLERSRRQQPVEQVPEPAEPAPLEEDPERAALLGRQQAEVREATAELPPNQRLVLALREVEDRSYAEIGEIAGLKENAVAQAIFRARQSLRERLRLAQVDQSAMPAECRARLPLLSAHLDGQLKGPERDELVAHLEGCEHCRRALADMDEAQRRYRALLPPIVVLPGLRDEVEAAVEASGFWQAPVPGAAATTGRTAGRLARLASPVGAAVVVGLVALAGLGAYLATRDGGGSGDDGQAPVPASGGGWEKVSRDGLSILTSPAVAVAGDRVVVAWPYEPKPTTAALEAASFASTPADPVGSQRLERIAAGWRSISGLSLLPGPGGLRALFGGLHTTVTADPLNGTRSVTRTPDGSWAPDRPDNQPGPYTGTPGTPWDSATVLSDGTPVFGVGVNEVLARRGLATDAESHEIGPGVFPVFGADGAGAVWVAWQDDGIVMRQLDPATGAPRGAAQRAPAVDTTHAFLNQHTRMACNAAGAGCRVVYLGSGALKGRLVSWAPGEREPTVVAKVATLRDYDAAYRRDGRLWVAWYDRGEPAGLTRQGHYVMLGDAKGAGAKAVFASQPRRALTGDWDLQIEPAGNGLVLAANLQLALKVGPAIWVTHLDAR